MDADLYKAKRKNKEEKKDRDMEDVPLNKEEKTTLDN